MNDSTSKQNSSKRKPGRGKKLFFFFLYLFFLALVAEGAARLTWRFIDKSWGLLVPQEISRFDDKLGWTLAPGAEAYSKSTGRKVAYAVNSNGLRDKETPYEKPQGVFRIVLLGDSHTFGFGVPVKQHFSTLLEGYFDDVEVVNLGVNGYGVDQELLYLRQEGFKYHPDLVLVYAPHYADFRHMRDKVWGMGKPRFELRDGALVLTNSPVDNNSFLYVAAIDTDRFLSSYSMAYRLLRDAVLHFRMKKPDIEERPEMPSKEVMKPVNRMGEAIVMAMADDCKRRGVEFAVVTRIGELAIAAFQAGVNQLFIAEPLINHGLDIKDDPTRHPNEAASGVIAWEIAKYLKEQGLVPKKFLHKLPVPPK